MPRIAVIAGLIMAAAISPGHANCLADSIGDNGPGAMGRYLHCRDMESRLDALEERQHKADAEAQQRAEREREAACYKAFDSAAAHGRKFSWIDCVQWPHRY